MIDTSKEYILCAAVVRKTPKPETAYHYDENDIHKIEIGYRHHDIMQRFGVELEHPKQGFYTSRGRYVDRQTAAKIAIESGQIEKLQYSEIDLYSEDLY